LDRPGCCLRQLIVASQRIASPELLPNHDSCLA
jgi:hypothetical protein